MARAARWLRVWVRDGAPPKVVSRERPLDLTLGSEVEVFAASASEAVATFAASNEAPPPLTDDPARADVVLARRAAIEGARARVRRVR